GEGSFVFEDGTYGHEHIYYGNAGETVSILLESSDFDAFLMLFSDTDELLAYDDDTGGGSDSLIVIELPHSGVYYIVVNTLSPGEEGEYTLTVETLAP